MNTNHKTTLLAIRHGETRWNADERFQGHGDSHLTETGRNQVEALGLRMKEFEFNSLISSDLGRAQETAAIIAHYTGHTVETDSRIRERNYGVLEGLTVPEIKAQHSEILEKLDENDPDYRVPKGESHRQHYERRWQRIQFTGPAQCLGFGRFGTVHLRSREGQGLARGNGLRWYARPTPTDSLW